ENCPRLLAINRQAQDGRAFARPEPALRLEGGRHVRCNRARNAVLAGSPAADDPELATRCAGGSRCATLRKNALSVLIIGAAKAARSTARQPSQLAPANQGANMRGSVSAVPISHAATGMVMVVPRHPRPR